MSGQDAPPDQPSQHEGRESIGAAGGRTPIRLVRSLVILAVVLGVALLIDRPPTLRTDAAHPSPSLPVTANASKDPPGGTPPPASGTKAPSPRDGGAGSPGASDGASLGATSAPTARPTPKPTPRPTPKPTSKPTPKPTPKRTPKPGGSGDYLLIDRADLLALPTSGSAWANLRDVADGSLGTADLCDQDNKHAVKTLGVALVYARTGKDAYRTKARDAIMAAIRTVRVGCNNAILSLGRQLGAYVLAADFIGLSGSDNATFRSWLSDIRTRDLGGHGRWRTLRGTHEDSANNWGTFAGASRIAASMYLGASADVSRAAKVFHGFLGDRGSWSKWGNVYAETDSWSCNPARFTPINGSCSRDGINLDGAIPADVSRGGDLRWPPGRDGKLYELEALQGLILQAELLSRAGYPAWSWENAALRRAARFVTRADGWNLSSASYNVPWLLNRRYGLGLPTKAAGIGRVFGYTDWLYGS